MTNHPAGPIAMTGTIARVIADKGFGFIRTASGVEYFVHRSACLAIFDDLVTGDPVTFDGSIGPKGPRAEHVERG